MSTCATASLTLFKRLFPSPYIHVHVHALTQDTNEFSNNWPFHRQINKSNRQMVRLMDTCPALYGKCSHVWIMHSQRDNNRYPIVQYYSHHQTDALGEGHSYYFQIKFLVFPLNFPSCSIFSSLSDGGEFLSCKM